MKKPAKPNVKVIAMKKLISIIIAICMLICVVPTAFAVENNNSMFLIASDLHYSPAPESLPSYNEDPMFFYSASDGLLRPESEAIIDKFLSNAASSDAGFILLAGDLVDRASTENHEYLAGKLADFKSSTGKNVYVIDGNHDVSASFTKDDFKNTYADFGYNQAVSVDEASCSYAVDLNNKLRLIAIDSSMEGFEGVLQYKTLEWVSKQAEKARADGKTPIAMIHHGVAPHIDFMDIFFERYMIRHNQDVGDVLLKNGINLVFTGHFHVTDTASYKPLIGQATLFDVATGSLIANNCGYRVVTISNGTLNFKTETVDEIDVSQTASLYSAEQLEMLENDFATYAKSFYKTGFSGLFESLSSAQMYLSIFGIERDTPAYRATQKFAENAEKYCKMPVYASDAEGGESLEALASEMKLSAIPKSDYKNAVDVASCVESDFAKGDENHKTDSTEFKICKTAFKIFTTKVAESLTDEEAKGLADAVVDRIVPGVTLPISDSKAMLVSAMTLAFDVVFNSFCNDNAPADNNISIAVYAEDTEQKEESILDKILNLLRKALSVLFAWMF